jgi:elongation factor Ts
VFRSNQADLEREKNILREEAKTSGKAPEHIEKIITGRLRKFYKEYVLVEQDCMLGEPGITIQDMLKKAAAAAGQKSITLACFGRFKVGEREVGATEEKQ